MSFDDDSTSSGSGFGSGEDDIDVAAYPTPDVSEQDETPENSDEDTSDTGSTRPEPIGPVIMAARAYQLEMLEQSLRENIIVAVCPLFTTSGRALLTG